MVVKYNLIIIVAGDVEDEGITVEFDGHGNDGACIIL